MATKYMEFFPFEVTTPHIAYATLGGFIVLFGMFSLFLRSRLYISEACWAFLFGVIIGPYCGDIFNPRAWAGGSSSSSPAELEHAEEVVNTIVLEITRVVLAIGVFAIGVELPKQYMLRHWKSLFFLLVPVMTWGWIVSAAFIYALIPSLPFVSALAISACLTPTDPILAAAVIGGKWADKHVPAHLRHLLAAESGCNDGAAFPFLFLALYIMLDVDPGRAMRDWFLILWLYQIALGVVLGALLGFSFRHLMKFCERLDLIDRHSYVAQYVSLAMFTIGVCTLLGTDDLLAAFACGTAFAWDGFFNKQTHESVFSSVIDLLFNIATFIFVGAWMPFDKFQNDLLGLEVWRLIVIAILVLLFRRLPIMIALYKWIPDVKNFREACFSGHFGPMGIGAIFISTFAMETIHRAHRTELTNSNYDDIVRLTDVMQPIVAFMVLCSITVHGLSIPSFSLGRRVHSVGRTYSMARTLSLRTGGGRTWSRHPTIDNNNNGRAGGLGRGGREGAGGGHQPEWTNQARIVTRGEDIVINRDSDSHMKKTDYALDRDNSDLERGLGEKKEDFTREWEAAGAAHGNTTATGTAVGTPARKSSDGSAGGTSGNNTQLQVPNIARTSPELRFSNAAEYYGVEEEERELSLSSPPRSVPALSATPRSAASLDASLPPPPLVLTAAAAASTGLGNSISPPEQAHSRRRHHSIADDLGISAAAAAAVLARSKEPRDDDDDNDDGDDGAEVLEWREGDQRVVETRRGWGEDVEVTVIHDPRPPGTGRRASLERTVSNGLQRVGSRVRDAVVGGGGDGGGGGGVHRPPPTKVHHRTESGAEGRAARGMLGIRRRRSSGAVADNTTTATTTATADGPGAEGESENEHEHEDDNDEGPGGKSDHSGRKQKQKQKGMRKRAVHQLHNLVAGRSRRSRHDSPRSSEPSAQQQHQGVGGVMISAAPEPILEGGSGAATPIPSFFVTPAEEEDGGADGDESDGGGRATRQRGRRHSGEREGDRLRSGGGGGRQATRSPSPARSIRFAEGTRETPAEHAAMSLNEMREAERAEREMAERIEAEREVGLRGRGRTRSRSRTPNNGT